MDAISWLAFLVQYPETALFRWERFRGDCMVPVGAVVSVGAPEGSGDWQPFDRPRSRLWHDVIDREFAVGAPRSSAAISDSLSKCVR